MLLEKLLRKQQKHIVALVGAGGKTTVMYELAEALAQQGRRVLVTTSTHILQPTDELWSQSLEEAQALWSRGSYAVVGQAEAGTGKLVGLPELELQQYVDLADVVLVEADGAKHYPCKVPREGEPVIPHACDIVMGVMAMDALGKTLQECCFRLEQACQLLDCTPEHELTLTDMAKILLSEQGTRKGVGQREYYVVLNKCDNETLSLQAEKLAEMLVQQGLAARHIYLRNHEHGLWPYATETWLCI